MNQVRRNYLHSKADLTNHLDAGCNIVDIGANTGDTPLVLAVAAKGGTVVAFEMGPPIDLLRVNKRFVERVEHLINCITG